MIILYNLLSRNDVNFAKKDCFTLINFSSVLRHIYMFYFSDVIIVSERFKSSLSIGVKKSHHYNCVAENGAGTVGSGGPTCNVKVISPGKNLFTVPYEFTRTHSF